ncbi:hypothetical protein NYP20_12770 [Pseudomonas sp. N3-W]|uniref:NEL-type E3 ubiquitin ligase domain-containing protein n=1 Tax=Pseudomonas sp. N3-W TaxID=2975049 RepID=UPI00217E3F12|nr:NEL-type E3 ubiquitin ligase domain-containing protein [Pseudomonas sp. N3-W]UWF51779.1 hypothetical protein NYP20_12770 [Pseudomonas sp. N3-W]
MSSSTPLPGMGLHTELIKDRLPGWIAHSASADIRRLRSGLLAGHTTPDSPPSWAVQASQTLRQALADSQKASRRSHTALAKTLEGLKGITAFAEPLLSEALRKKFGQAPDVNNHALYYLRYRQSVQQHSLLQAALLNFEGNEDFHDISLEATSALAPKDALKTEYYGEVMAGGRQRARHRYSEKLSITPDDFSTLCRSLDLGQQYQSHLEQVFETPASKAQVRQQMITAQKDLLAIRVHTARMKNEISESAYTLLLAILAGTDRPKLDDKPVAYSQLKIFGFALGEIVLIGPGVGQVTAPPADWYSPFTPGRNLFESASNPSGGRLVAWIPGAPLYPVREYASMEAFKTDLAISLRSPAYQQFFASLLPQDDAAAFLNQLKDKLYTWKWNANGLKEQVFDDAIDLNLRETVISDELFGALYDKHLQRLKANARLLAVPTADADRKAAQERHEHWLSIGLNMLNVAAFIVPGVGEVMLVVTAIQLGLEVYHGIESWKDGDMVAAWGHLESVALNVAFIAALGGAGIVASRAPVIQVSRWVDGLVPVKLSNGEARLWKPDLAPYKSDVVLAPSIKPNALGQYETGGKIYVRIGDGLYEKGFDAQLKKWRVKHPTDSAVYQPVLEGNNNGGWRGNHERPLEWDRLTLLRRMGHHTEAFSDDALNTIGDISGVQDEVLRKMHVDGLPVPSLLADTLQRFRIDREVSELIEQIRTGRGLDPRYEYVMPLLVEMPRWPAGRVLEVFDGPEPWGRSRLYGSPLSAADVRATIKVTRAEVLGGKLSQRVLAELSEEEALDVLGSRAVGEGAEREALFNSRLADVALKRQKAIFQSLERSAEPAHQGTEGLQRRYPQLSDAATREILNTASAGDRTQMHTTGTIPRRVDNAARAYLQQRRLNRAIAGLQRENMASVDSDRLALHGLEQLAQWPADLRLELHADHFNGRLLDSVGDENASVRKYLVKDGERFQAYDERGQTLNSVAPHGRHLFDSIMHALPDEARQGLGLPRVTQGPELQQALARHALGHRREMAGILKQRQPMSRPTARLGKGRLGYGLTGRGDAFRGDASLIARVRDVYPNITEEEASRFVLGRLANGEEPRQIVHLLNNRQRELTGLWAVLEHWVAADGNLMASRQRVSDNLISCWRENLYRGQLPEASVDLTGVDELPVLTADFSHVQALYVGGRAIAAERGAALLRQFPGVRRLELYVDQELINQVSESLAGLTTITELAIHGWGLRCPPEFVQRLSALTQLERLSVAGSTDGLDVSGMARLRWLSVTLMEADWPAGILQLEQLESLSLSGDRVGTLPEGLFTGHERLWRGLHLDWSNFDPQTVVKAFEYLHDNPAHLVDEQAWVTSYAKRSLERLGAEDPRFPGKAIAEFRRQGLTPREMLDRINNVREEQRDMRQGLLEWQARTLRVDRRTVDPVIRERCVERILACWRNGLSGRYTEDALPPGRLFTALSDRAVLDLSAGVLGDLPPLPRDAFAHVRRLNIAGVKASTEDINGFLKHFPRLAELNLSGNSLTELPPTLVDLKDLTHLDLSYNQLTVTGPVQHQLSRLGKLRVLSLPYNRIVELDVSTLTDLVKLDLSHTALRNWPKGVLDLPGLQQLDLSYSAITTIPEAALSGHDVLLLLTSVRGCRLTPPARAALLAYGERAGLGNLLGIPKSTLAEGLTGGDPEYFPVEVADDPRLLLSLPLEPVGGELRLTPAAQLQRLDPGLGNVEAIQRVTELSASGLSALEIEARLGEWRQQHQTLIRQLNAWIDIRAYREGGGWVSAIDRRRAADRILQSWRVGLRPQPVAGPHVLDFDGLTLGDLPGVSKVFNHVTELNLSAIKLTEQGSNEFLRAFPNLRSLMLNKNGLARLPEPVAELKALTRLDAASNDLRDVVQLQRELGGLPALETLDLSENTLSEFDVTGMTRLKSLDLHGNVLSDWPTGVLVIADLSSLNLSNNQIETIPPEALQPEHRALMAGTNLSDNLLLEHEFEILRAYLRDTGNGLGFSDQEIERMIDGYAQTEESAEGSDAEDVHPDYQTPQEQKNRWFAGVAADSEKHGVWDALKDADDNHNFFYILSQLPQTKDFKQDVAELTRRVWDVLDSAHESQARRESLFDTAAASMNKATCGDGWILLFSDLELNVYQFNALRSATAGQEGPKLFKLATGMIRIDEVEAVASDVIRARPGIDPAEIRLAYRIGLAQRLELPRQPVDMLYRNVSRVTQADIDRAYTSIIDKERTPVFLQNLVKREYWVDYLKRQYPADYTELTRSQQLKYEALEARHANLDAHYQAELLVLTEANNAEQTQLAIRLSARERTRMGL